MAGHEHPAQDAAGYDADHPHRIVDKAEIYRRESQAALCLRIHQECGKNLEGESLRKAIQQHESDACPDERLAEKRGESPGELAQDRPGGTLHANLIGGRRRQGPQVIQGQRRPQNGRAEQGEAPGLRDISGPALQHAREHYQRTLHKKVGYPVESGPDAHKQRLLLSRKRQHIEAVGGDIMRGRCESRDPEQHQGGREQGDIGPGPCRKGKRQAQEKRHHGQLRGHHPPALGPEDIHEGTPERLDQPGKVQQAGVQGHIGIAHPHLLEQDDGDVVHDEVRDALCEVKRGHPEPGRAGFHKVVPG